MADRATGAPAAPRIASWGFHGACAASVVFYLYVGRRQWFHQDEFVILTTGVGSVGDLFAPHNSHLIVPARAVYAALWPVFGLDHYELYQLPVVLAHVAVAIMIRHAILRTGVSTWLATAVALVFLAFGRGYPDIIWAFQITFTGAIAFGYAQLLLADHDGPLGRRDLLGVLAGVLAVTSAAPGLVMVGTTGLAMLLRRGRNVAAVHTVPTALLFLAWSLLTDRSEGSAAPAEVARFAVRGLALTGERITPWPPLALVLAVSVLVGLVLMARRVGVRASVHRFAVPLSLALGAVGMFLLTGRGRADSHGIGFAGQPRYSHIGLALLAPVLAVGLQGLVDRWRALLVPLIVLVVSGIPANLASVELSSSQAYSPDVVLATAQSPALEHMDPSTAVFPGRTGYRSVTAGWLLDARRAGRIPTIDVADHLRIPVLELVALGQVPIAVDPRTCHVLEEEVRVSLDAGRSIDLNGPVIVWPVTVDGPLAFRGMSSDTPYRLVSHVDGLELTIGAFKAGEAQIC